MFDLEDLRTFVEVADAGGVTPAARRLALTEAGASFREHAARVTAELDAARETISPEGDVRGRLRIAAPLSFGPTHLAPVLAELARRHPKLQVHAIYSDRFV